MNERQSPDPLTLFSYLLVAAILLPLGWWLKAHHSEDIGYFILSLGGLLY